MIHKHNSICDNKYPKIYDNTANVTSNTYRFLNALLFISIGTQSIAIIF